jgi:hypothetical protein
VILPSVPAVSDFARGLGTVFVWAVPASLAIGLVGALLKDEDILRWLAYGLDMGGAVLIGLGFLSSNPSARSKYLARLRGEEPATGESRLLLFVTAGVLMLAAGTLIELAL